MHEIASGDGAELTRGEESRDRDFTECAADRTHVVIWLPEESLTSAVARKEERAGDRIETFRLEHRTQILARRLRIAHLELDRLPYLSHVADRDRAGVAVDADEIADDEVAAAELGLELGGGLADVQPATHEQLVALGRVRVELFDALERGLTAELEHHVALGACDRERLPDRTAPLRDDGGRAVRSFEDRADRAF